MTDQNALATIKHETVDLVADKVRMFAESGELHFPPDYSPENALKSAFLVLQETKNKDNKPVLDVCTRPSIANALLNMVVQGLNPAKKQGYFIAYGTTLTFQRSYFGTMALAMRVRPDIEDITAQVIYEGDEFEYAIERGTRKVVKHVQKMENVDRTKIKGAYCTVYFEGGREKTVIMTMTQIKEAWKQSQMKPITDSGDIKKGSTHERFTEEMACKTVVNRACKPIINSSDDSDLVIKAFRESDQDVAEARALEAMDEEANAGEVIDVPCEVVDDGPVQETLDHVASGEPPF